ncbi:hypothetical protein HYC85_011310 [Camellia sinensis]|uniref:Aconitase A/isopropylmalate dehydratase small subunit swivel domain-containing protein n=1 Tax=Camellia sinensis TaxID=4442 RepID=A0A7J7H9X2_CAMSI|nr:hypothetical protein HYC85_011310 [Camellia sinensis]
MFVLCPVFVFVLHRLTLTLPIGVGKDDKNVYFKDIWPSTEEVAERIAKHVQEYLRVYNKAQSYVECPTKLYSWDPHSTYIHEPRYFKNMTMDPPRPNRVNDVYCLLNFGDSITTDHISPAGSLNKDSPATKYLLEHRVERKDFNSYGSCRGNDEVMARGTFVNFHIVNKLLNGEVGPKTFHVPTGEKLRRYKAAGHDTIVLVGAEYGSGGSSRDWATKGPMLLVSIVIWALELVRTSPSILACIVSSSVPFSNYWNHGEDADSLGLTGHERYTIDLPNIINEIRLGQDVTVRTDTGKSFTCTVRFDTEVCFRLVGFRNQVLLSRFLALRSSEALVARARGGVQYRPEALHSWLERVLFFARASLFVLRSSNSSFARA